MDPSAPATPEVIVGRRDDTQSPLPLASEGVQRWVWVHRFGEMLIEVKGGEVFVDGKRVEQHGPL